MDKFYLKYMGQPELDDLESGEIGYICHCCR